MNLIRIRIGGGNAGWERELGELSRPMRHIFDPFAGRRELGWRPHIDIYEDGGGFTVMVELAGVELAHIDLEISGGLLKLSGRRNRRSLSAGACYHLAEIAYGFFERVFSIPEDIDTEKVEASYREGILEIHLQKVSRKVSRERFTIRHL